jgi:methionine--tRNA ligase beta chain
MMETISFEEVMKVEMRVGAIVEAEEVEGSSKLVQMKVDFGEKIGERTIFAGIKKWYKPEELVGKQTAFFMNLAPKKMGDFGESQGMLVAAEVFEGEERTAVLMLPDKKVPLGSRVL